MENSLLFNLSGSFFNVNNFDFSTLVKIFSDIFRSFPRPRSWLTWKSWERSWGRRAPGWPSRLLRSCSPTSCCCWQLTPTTAAAEEEEADQSAPSCPGCPRRLIPCIPTWKNRIMIFWYFYYFMMLIYSIVFYYCFVLLLHAVILLYSFVLLLYAVILCYCFML